MLAGLTTSDWLNIGGGAIAVIGFAVTLLQLARVKKALDRHVTRSAGEMLAFSIAQLERFEGDIRHAANDGSSQLLTRAVLDWRGGAADARALLPYALPEDADDDLDTALELSLAMVDAVLRVLDSNRQDLPQLVRPLVDKASAAIVAGRAATTDLSVRGK